MTRSPNRTSRPGTEMARVTTAPKERAAPRLTTPLRGEAVQAPPDAAAVNAAVVNA